jgi:hypothetical protein
MRPLATLPPTETTSKIYVQRNMEIFSTNIYAIYGLCNILNSLKINFVRLYMHANVVEPILQRCLDHKHPTPTCCEKEKPAASTLIITFHNGCFLRDNEGRDWCCILVKI